MSRAASIPADTDLLCERCGYVLNGLSDEGRCPECGTPIAESTIDNPRRPPAFERSSPLLGFLLTTAAVIFTPTRFFRGTTARGRPDRSAGFAITHWTISTLLMGAALVMHLDWVAQAAGQRSPGWVHPFLLLLLIFLSLWITTSVAARLTVWEASYRGIRLPLPVVLRAMHYHAAHYLPVAIAAAAIVFGGQELMSGHRLAPTHYLYILCAYVVIAAGYLFHTYWIGMRNVMYANR